MDNVKCHCVFHEDVLRVHKLKKKELCEFLSSKNIPHKPTDTAPLPKKKANDCITEHEEMEVVRLAKIHGHEVLWMPLCCSNLQPIKLVWAWMKGHVGQQCDINATLANVCTRPPTEFK